MTGCRVGVAIEPAEHVAEMKREGRIPSHATHWVVLCDLTYEKALYVARRERERCGSGCESELGGRNRPGDQWSVYRIDW